MEKSVVADADTVCKRAALFVLVLAVFINRLQQFRGKLELPGNLLKVIIPRYPVNNPSQQLIKQLFIEERTEMAQKSKETKGRKAKKVDSERDKELMEYLKKHFFIEKFNESVKEMMDMDPNLPKDPVKYLKTHIDYTNKEAREVERELKSTRKAIAKFEEENAILKYQLQLYEPEDGTASWSTTSRSDGEKKHPEGKNDTKKSKKP